MEETIVNEVVNEELAEGVTDAISTVCEESSGGFSVGKTILGAGIVGAIGYAGYRLWKWAKDKKAAKEGRDWKKEEAGVVEGEIREIDEKDEETMED